MRTLRQSASGRRLWRPSRTLFVASLILAVAVVGSIAAAAPGGTQPPRPSAWTWEPTPHGSAASNASASSPQSGPAGTVLTGPTGGHVVVGQSSRNDTSAPLRNMATPFTPSTEHQVIPVLPLPKSTTTQRKAGASVGDVQTKLAAPKIPGTQLNFEGIDFPGVNCNCAPPDTNGAVGATQYVQIVNTGLPGLRQEQRATRCSGRSASSRSGAGFGGVCENNGEGDPIVLYDQLANRWLISQFAGTAQPTDECVAVSTSATPQGPGTATTSISGHFGNNFYDYPKLGVWPDAYYMSTNVFNSAGTAFLGPQPFAFDRAAMLAGTPATFVSTGIARSDGRPAHAGRPRRLDPAPVGRAEPVHRDRDESDLEALALPRRLRQSGATRPSPWAARSTPDPFNVVCGGARRSLRAAGGRPPTSWTRSATAACSGSPTAGSPTATRRSSGT